MAPEIRVVPVRRASQMAGLVFVATMIGAPVPGQATPPAAVVELAGALADLRAAIEAFAHPPEPVPGPRDVEVPMRMVAAVAARLDLFEQLFGCRRETVKGWLAIQSVAKAALGSARTKGGDPYDTIDSSDMTRAILQEIAGEPEAALASLAKIKPGGMCGNRIATVNLATNMRRSAILQHMGRHQEALAAHEEAVGCVGPALDRESFPALFVRYALLLEQNDRATDAWLQYQRVVDLFPGTTEDTIARSRLTAERKLIPPTAARVVAYLGSYNRREATFALVTHKFPDSLSILLARLASDALGKDEVVEALARLGDPRAIPPLQVQVESGPAGWIPALLCALHHLGDTSRIVVGLQRLRNQTWVGMGDARRLQEVLLQLAPDGPRPSPYEPLTLVKAWAEYLEKAAADSRPTTDSRAVK